MQYFFAIIVLIAVNIGCFVLFIHTYKRMVSEQIASIDKKAGQLEAALDSADQMINELNNLSDFIVSNIEQSNVMYEKSNADLNEKIQQSNELAQQLYQFIEEYNIIKKQANSTYVSDDINPVKLDLQASNDVIDQKEEKILGNAKYIQATRLAEQGMSVREIAQQLNMGQGEIKLVLGIKK